MSTDQKTEEGAPESDRTTDSINWRMNEDDQALFARVKGMLKIRSNADVLRFALGAAERELSRSAGRVP